MVCKKKLHLLNPNQEEESVKAYISKRKTAQRSADIRSVEHGVRDLLEHKVSGTLLGIWLLVPEHLQLGTWELLTTWSGDREGGVKPRLALQMVHEAVICATGVRQSRCLCHQGFEIANGLPFIATDQEIHHLLDAHTVQEAQELQVRLGLLRQSRGHYQGELLAFDPHRIPTCSRRIMPKKKSHPKKRSRRVLQTFFSVDAETG